MSRTPTSLTFFALGTILAIGAARAANQVLVVDATGAGGAFTSVQDAIDAAGDGDVVLVRPGDYDTATISGKSVSLLGDFMLPEQRPSVAAIQIDGLAAGQKAVARGLEVFFLPFLAEQTEAVVVANNAGAVILEDLDIVAIPVDPDPGTVSTMRIDGSARVLVVRCEATGGQGLVSPFPGQPPIPPKPALRVAESNVFVYDSTLTGGPGSDSSPPFFPLNGTPSQPGGAGVVVASGFLFASGGAIAGGAGGDGATGFFGFCEGSSDGGTGLVAGGGVALLDCAVAGGAAGLAQPACPPNGVAGAATLVTTGSISGFADVARSLEITSPLHEGVSGTLAVHGVPGDSVLLLRSFAPQATFVLALKGALICQPPLFVTALGALPPSGELLVPIVVATGTLPPSIDAIEIYEQVAVPGASGTGLLSAPTAVAIVK